MDRYNYFVNELSQQHHKPMAPSTAGIHAKLLNAIQEYYRLQGRSRRHSVWDAPFFCEIEWDKVAEHVVANDAISRALNNEEYTTEQKELLQGMNRESSAAADITNISNVNGNVQMVMIQIWMVVVIY